MKGSKTLKKGKNALGVFAKKILLAHGRGDEGINACKETLISVEAMHAY
jgi:hypothetical protein